MNRDDLGDRMKRYEDVPRISLVPRSPVIMRLDGKAFHTLTRNMKKPWDQDFQKCMWAAAKALCEEVQGCRLAYVQSDEISLLLVDYQSLQAQGWFDYQLQKMVSVGASIAAMEFDAELRYRMENFSFAKPPKPRFDARAFNLPREEVTNYFIWRQQDATRNSISSAAQAQFSHKELHGKSCADMQDMLHEQRGINWNDYPTAQKRGVCVVKGYFNNHSDAPRTKWVVDDDIPIFTQERNYIERYVTPEGP